MSVVLPASGWLMMAKVRRRAASSKICSLTWLGYWPLEGVPGRREWPQGRAPRSAYFNGRRPDLFEVHTVVLLYGFAYATFHEVELRATATFVRWYQQLDDPDAAALVDSMRRYLQWLSESPSEATKQIAPLV